MLRLLRPITVYSHIVLTAGPSRAAPNEQDDEEEFEGVAETDEDRRNAILESRDKSDLDDLKGWSKDYSDEFVMPPRSAPPAPEIMEISSDEDSTPAPSCGLQSFMTGGSSTSAISPPDTTDAAPKRTTGRTGAPQSRLKPSTSKLSYGGLVLDEIQIRKKESLGMDGNGRRLGDGSGKARTSGPGRPLHAASNPSPPPAPTATGSWTCQVCTL